MKLRPCASWNIVGLCNYNCTYCVQKPSSRKGVPTPEQIERFVRTWEALPGTWEFKISGGEPFMLPNLHEVAARLARRGHAVSILTNLSASREELKRFVECAGTQLRTFSTSLHREMIGEEEFIDQVAFVKDCLAPYPRATMVVNSVLVPDQLDELRETKKKYEAIGVKWYPQMMRVNGRNYHYREDEWALVQDLIGKKSTPREVNMGYSFTGVPCYAGAKYFIVTHKGHVYSCYPGKRHGDGYLGNVLKGTFKLWEGQRPCPYDVCPCTVPQNRGIVDPKRGIRVVEPAPTLAVLPA